MQVPAKKKPPEGDVLDQIMGYDHSTTLLPARLFPDTCRRGCGETAGCRYFISPAARRTPMTVSVPTSAELQVRPPRLQTGHRPNWIKILKKSLATSRPKLPAH